MSKCDSLRWDILVGMSWAEGPLSVLYEMVVHQGVVMSRGSLSFKSTVPSVVITVRSLAFLACSLNWSVLQIPWHVILFSNKNNQGEDLGLLCFPYQPSVP